MKCHNCNHEEIAGAIFCSICGAQLLYMEDQSPETTISTNLGELTTQTHLPSLNPPSASSIDAEIALYVKETGEILPLSNESEYTLGRATKGQPIIPDIDLSPYHAYESGVSRLHASIQITDTPSIIDLGSVNGTRVNGVKIPPNISQPLHNGDTLTLGKIELQIIIKD